MIPKISHNSSGSTLIESTFWNYDSPHIEKNGQEGRRIFRTSKDEIRQARHIQASQCGKLQARLPFSLTGSKHWEF